jgi:hypothetical protein
MSEREGSCVPRVGDGFALRPLASKEVHQDTGWGVILMHLLKAYDGVLRSYSLFRGIGNLVIWHVAICLRSSERVESAARIASPKTSHAGESRPSEIPRRLGTLQ